MGSFVRVPYVYDEERLGGWRHKYISAHPTRFGEMVVENSWGFHSRCPVIGGDCHISNLATIW